MAEEKYKVGDRFGKWTLLYKLSTKNGCTNWWCACDCGAQKEVYAHNLTTGKSKMCRSCGAKDRERRKREGK